MIDTNRFYCSKIIIGDVQLLLLHYYCSMNIIIIIRKFMVFEINLLYRYSVHI